MSHHLVRVFCCFTLFFVTSFNILQGQDKIDTQVKKYEYFLQLIEALYVDSANLEDVTERAITEALMGLDPHSTYISSEDVKRMNEPLKGNFEGIGISFNIYKDTLIVLSTIAGGPSELVGMMPGDRIVEVDGKNIAGIGIKSSDVMDMLRGKKGTSVDIKVLRGDNRSFDFLIIRDKIPLYSLDAAYMLNKETAFIKLNRFSETTSLEFLEAIVKLKSQNTVRNLILDLRGNGGGVMSSAIEVADQFLNGNKLIVYVQGLNSPRQEYMATDKGEFLDGKLAILADQGSASASEIVCGAAQDWDRGIIIGRRSFGKGLVQRPLMLPDMSVIRMTTAHYYTPGGRNIQKPYESGVDDYRMDYYKRLERGEHVNKDSIDFVDSLMVRTLVSKRKVYGGGGIMPDIFVPMDTSANYAYLNKLIGKNVLLQFAIGYTDQNRDRLVSEYKTFDQFKQSFNITDEDMDLLVREGEKEGVEKDEEGLAFSYKIIKRQVKAIVARDLFEKGVFYQVLYDDDKEIAKALEVLSDDRLYKEYLSPK